jgi:hypothetical protein
MAGSDRSDVERLRAYWDGVVQGDLTVPEDLDPSTVATVQQLHAWYRPPLPNLAFHTRLQEELMNSAAVSPLDAAPKAPWSGSQVTTNPRGWSAPAGRGRVLEYLASAALVLVTLVAAYLAFGPSHHVGAPTGPSTSVPALQAPATPAPSDMTEGMVLQTTNFGIAEELPEAPVSIHFDRIELPSGASSFSPASDLGLGAYVIESGTAILNPTEDIELFQDGQPHGVTFGGDDTQLEPGEGFILEPNIGGEIRNDGTEPVVFVVISVVPGTPEEPASAPGL